MVMRYQTLETDQTLAEGLSEFRASIQPKPTFSDNPETQRMFDAHDSLHVLFALDTRVLHESLVDLHTLMGSDAGLKVLIDYSKAPEIKEIFKEAGVWPLAKGLIHALRYIPHARRNAKAMSKKWEWWGYERYLNTPLSELRAEYGVGLADGIPR